MKIRFDFGPLTLARRSELAWFVNAGRPMFLRRVA